MIKKETLERKYQILFIVSICCTFILVYVLNWLYPLFADDWFYSFIYNDKNIRVTSLSNVLESQINHYSIWGGRSVVHALDQILLMQNFNIICLLNTVAFILFVYLLYKIANRGNTINPFVFLLFSLLIWFSQPAFFETVIWKTGSANYLWGSLIVISFMCPYYYYYRSGKYKENVFKTLLFFICGIIAGWTNENMSLALIFFIVTIGFVSYKKKISIPKWGIAGLLGVIIGCLFLLLAPGNFVRLEGVKATYGWQDISFIKTIWIGTKNILRYTWLYILPLLAIYLLLLCIYNRYPKDLKDRNIIIYGSLVFLATGFVALGAMVASLIFPERSLFGIIILFLIPIGIIYANIDIEKTYFRYLNIGVLCIFLFLFGTNYYKSYQDLHSVSIVFKERKEYIEEQKARGIDSIVFTKALPTIDEKKYFIWDLTDNPEGWTNKAYARFNGLKSVNLVIDKKEYN